MSSDWTSLIWYLAVPWALRTGFNLLSSRRSQAQSPSITKKPLQRPWTTSDRLSSYFLLASALAYFTMACFPPQNFLKTLSVDETTPNYKVRNSFRDIMDKKYPAWYFGMPVEQLETSFSADVVDDITRWTTLYESVKPKSGREAYVIFGHDAFTGCSWCSEKEDFALYVSGDLALKYTAFLGVIGLGTMSHRFGRTNGRLFAFWTVLSIGLADAYVLSMAPAITLPMSESPFNETQYNQMYGFRYALFGLISFLSCIAGILPFSLPFLGGGNTLSEKQRLDLLVSEVQVNFARETAVRLARGATLGDAELRAKFLEFYKRVEVENSAFDNDPEYQELKRLTLKKNNVTTAINEAREMASKLISMAQTEGALGKVVLPPEIPFVAEEDELDDIHAKEE